MLPEIDSTTRSLLEELLKRCCAQTGCGNSALWLADDDHLIPVLGHGSHAADFINNYRHPLSEGIISMVHASGQPFCENNIANNPQHSSRLDQKLGIQTQAMIAAPIVTSGEIVGVLTCVHTCPAGTNPDASEYTFNVGDTSEIEFTAAIVGRIMQTREEDAVSHVFS